jgi:hypothetical protein
VTNCGRVMSRLLERNRSSRWRCPFFPDAPCLHSVHISPFMYSDPARFNAQHVEYRYALALVDQPAQVHRLGWARKCSRLHNGNNPRDVRFRTIVASAHPVA